MLGMISLFTLHSEVPPIRRVAGPAHHLLRSERAEETLTNKHVLIILGWSVQKGRVMITDLQTSYPNLLYSSLLNCVLVAQSLKVTWNCFNVSSFFGDPASTLQHNIAKQAAKILLYRISRE